jgi:hypothetical protein
MSVPRQTITTDLLGPGSSMPAGFIELQWTSVAKRNTPYGRMKDFR